MKSWKIPTPDQVSRTIALITQIEQYRYFFDKLDNPEWIIPLRKEGFFQNPPKIEKDEANNLIRFPPWPESRYLARMSLHKPDVVVKTILQMADTENIRVYENLIDAALNMPAGWSVQLVNKAEKWIRTPYQQLLPDKLGNLIIHLAKGGQINHAIKLASVLLEIMTDSKGEENQEEDEPFKFPRMPDTKAHCGQWSYDQILKKIGPIIIETAKIDGLILFCDLLDSALRIIRPQNNNGPEDLSHIWRPSIEDHPQNIVPSIESSLIVSVRDVAEQLCLIDSANLTLVLQTLERRTPTWRAFSRIALYLLQKIPHVSMQLVTTYLLNPSLFEDLDCRHEYFLLLRQRFLDLDPKEKEELLNLAENPPPLTRTVPDEDARRIEDYRKLERLSRFGEQNLPEPWKSRFESLAQEFGGELPDSEFPHKITSFRGPTSPKNADELQTMPIGELITYLKEWVPPESFMGSSREGLGRDLASLVGIDPQRFSSAALQFQGLHPTYVRSFLQGLNEAIRNKKPFDWEPVLLLCKWVLEQEDDSIANTPDWVDQDKNWSWSRSSIARLLNTAFRKPDGLPLSLRTNIWDILCRLSDDPDPTPEDEERRLTQKNSPLDIAINSTRGVAMEAVILYGIWLHRSFEKMPDGVQKIDHGFDEMPEVREVLERHLDPSRDLSRAIRSIFGAMLYWLIKLDRNWVKDRISGIFPSDETLRLLREAVWENYLNTYQPSEEIFYILKEQYVIAVEGTGIESGEKRPSSYEMNLSGHLMALYWHGILDLEEPDGLMEKFWTRASEPLKGYALEFIGRSLYSTKDTVPPEILMRLKNLWGKRLLIAQRASDPMNHNDEMTVFGWWFVSGKFEDEWSLAQLVEALNISKKTDPEHLVVELLATLATTMPKQTLQCLEAIIKGDRDSFGIYIWIEQARIILDSAIRSGDADVAANARKLINHLGSRGHHEFRNLLQS